MEFIVISRIEPDGADFEPYRAPSYEPPSSGGPMPVVALGGVISRQLARVEARGSFGKVRS
jgi:hypothetical protein